MILCVINFIYSLDFKVCKKMMKFLISLKKDAESDKSKMSNMNTITYPELTISSIRKRFEDFLEIWGLDFNVSSKLWDIYCEFEINNLNFFSKIQDEENYNQTKNIIRSIFRRRLSFPHIDLDIVWNEYKNWEDEEDQIERVKAKYEEVNIIKMKISTLSLSYRIKEI
jgi:hypothetical protein